MIGAAAAEGGVSGGGSTGSTGSSGVRVVVGEIRQLLSDL